MSRNPFLIRSSLFFHTPNKSSPYARIFNFTAEDAAFTAINIAARDIMRDAVAAACAVYAALSAADCAAPVILDDNIVFAISLAKALFSLVRFFLHLFAASIATLSRLLHGYCSS